MPVPAFPLTKTIQIPYNPAWTQISWGCGDNFPKLVTGTYEVTFPGSLAPESKVTNVKVTMPMRRGGSYYAYGDANPVVGMTLNGQPIGASAVVPGYIQCPLRADLQDYTFEQPLTSGYNLIGSNLLTISVAGGTCPYWCGVTVVDPYVATIEVTYDPPPPVEFAITPGAPEPERRILISNVRPEFSYPHFQSIGAEDAAVSTFLRTRDANGNYKAGLTVYMRIVDPPDTAPYTTLAAKTLARNDDNHGAPAVLQGTGVTLIQPGVYQATSGSNGEIGFTVRMQPPFVGGDNYQIEASLDPSFPAASSVKSGTLTAWKRVFVEKRGMMRNGIFLAKAAKAGDTEIFVRGNKYGGIVGNNKLSKGQRILLVHGPHLDGSDAEWYMEEHMIMLVESLDDGTWRVRLGTKKGQKESPEPLLRDYGPDPSNPDIGDAVSHLSGATLSPDDYYDASDELVTDSVFAEANVEYIMLTGTPGSTVPMPFFETSNQTTLQEMADKWSSVVTRSPDLRRALPNHQLLIIASRGSVDQGGVTTHMVAGETSSWVFRRSIQQIAKQLKMNADGWAMKTSAHEIAHQWNANRLLFGGPSDIDHCGVDSTAYDDPSVYCLLASYDGAKSETQRDNGIARFHLVPHPNPGPGPFGAWHSEYFEIRKRSDPFRP